MRRILLLIALCLMPLVASAQQQTVLPMHTFQNAATATGNGTPLAVQGWATIGLQVVISDTATVTFEATTDGTNWVSRECSSVTDGVLSTTATASGVFQCSVAGISQFRARISSFGAGTVTVKGLATIVSSGKGSGLPGGALDGECLLWSTDRATWDTCPGAGTGAPTDATYITQTTNGSLSAEQALSALATGILKSTNGTGVVSIAAAGTDYVEPAGNVATATALEANGANCSAGSAPLGVDASGAAESCTNYAEEPSSNGIVTRTAANTITNRTITGTSNEISVADGDGVSGNPTLSLPATINLSSKTLRIPNGTELPGSCTVGDQFMDTDATTGERHYLCESANTWVLQGDGGGGGAGTVTSVAATGGVETASGSAIETTGTIRGVHIAKAETGTTYTVLTGDRGKALTLSNASPVAVTLPQAGTGFEDGWYVWVKNIGAGDATITPTTSTIDGTTELVLSQGQMAMIRSDGTNYQSYGKALLAEVDTVDTVFDRGKEIDGANSEANCFRVGDGTNHACFFWDATDGFRVTTDPIGDLTHWIPTNQNYVLHDEEGDKAVITVNPDAIGAGSGTVTLNTSEQLVASNLGIEFSESDTNPTCAAGNYNIYADTSETAIKICENGTAEVVSTPAGTETLTNKTFDAEATGNVLTTREERHFPVATCQNTTASTNFDTPTSNAPAATCDTGTNTQKGYLAFDASTLESFQDSMILPTGFTGAIDIHFRWKAVATTGAVGWCAQLIRVPDAATSDPAFPALAAGNCVSDSAKGTTLQENTATISGVTCTSCAAGDHVYIRISRDAAGTAVTDDMANDAFLLMYGRTVRTAQ